MPGGALETFPIDGGGVPLVDDGGIHRVDVLLG